MSTLVCATTAQAQRPDSAFLPLTTSYQWSGAGLDSLPVDSLRTALGFLPGVSPGSRGDLYVRGGAPNGLVTYLDGVPVQPGVRGGGLGTSVGPLTPWTAGLGTVDLTTGPYSSAFGNGATGLLRLITRSGGDHWTGSARYSTDELSGKAASFGVNRVEGTIGGPLGHHITFFAGAYVHGQQSATSGIDGAEAPIFVPSGVDTTLAVPSKYGDPLADTTYVAVANWAVYRGSCSTFAGSADPGIASNYGSPCQGARIPLSASTSERYQFRLDATPDDRTTLWLSALGGRDQDRKFDYFFNQDVQALTGTVKDSRAWTLGGRRILSPTVTAEAALSLQHDQSQDGPLDPNAEPDSRDPFGGFLIAPLALRWTLSNFPVDQQLVTNYQRNIGGSRITPYDLQNTAQYQIIDQWRNDAYGLLGYAEGGGPTGRLSLYDETRVVGRAALEWRSPSIGTISAGIEATHYNIANYSSGLTTLIFSNAWIEKPMATAAYISDRFESRDATVEFGLRYQEFSTGAQRPWLLDTAATSPTFDQYGAFPRQSTYGRNSDGTIATFNGQPLLQYRTDQSHQGLSPHIAIAIRLNDRTDLHAAGARMLELPDFGESFSGINTDLQLTNTQQVFGSDLGFLDATIFELGFTRRFGDGVTGAVTGYDRRDRTRPVASLRAPYDPATKETQEVASFSDIGSATIDGVEAQLSGRRGVFSGRLAYAYQHTTYLTTSIYGESDRPHTLTAIGTLAFPGDWHAGTAAGTILSRSSVTALVRYASGARDYGCPAQNFTAPAELCPDPGLVYLPWSAPPGRLPAFKAVDLRVSRGFDLAGHDVAFFVDAHNLFDFRNYNAALGPAPTTESASDQAVAFSGDSAGFASEAERNGAYNGSTGSIDLTFGGAPDPRAGCGAWQTAAGSPASPNCVALIRAEQRYGNGDGIFTVQEQQRASQAQYLLTRGLAALTDLPRRIRIGIEMKL
ncbi:MAG: TonB-dependent receptor plug domain-containing protein [Gemmatimonadales bacterium]